MVNDANPLVLVMQDATAGRLGQLPGRTALVLEQLEAETFDASGDADPVRVGDPDDLAYVIYTSGSTGTPKGVEVTHRNLTRLLTSTEPWFHFGPDDVWTLFHSYAFDFSVWELWGALAYGGRLVVVPYEISRSPEEFLELLHRERVTVLNQTPSAFRQLANAEAARGDMDLSLRLVIFGGEALDFTTLKGWLERHGDCRPKLVNMYGITETTVHVTHRPIAYADGASRSGSLIGRPIPDLMVRVLDRDGQLVPIGVPGELYVGGAGVARGYLRRPELTNVRFVTLPEAIGEGGRFYRSGDLVRYLSSGDLEYVGRIDHQVKIRGFRVELGEIEAALFEQPDVREAVVGVHDVSEGDRRLIAYVAPAEACDVETLRAALTLRLPDYMVPSAFIGLARLPRNSNDKVDRASLPAPAAAVRRSLAAPETPTEEALARIFCDVLSLADVGRHDDFFEMGGHSLLATQLLSRIRDVTGVELGMRDVFSSPKIEKLALLIENRRHLPPSRPAISPRRRRAIPALEGG
jgi:amino acid adenylation domain-containing protein